MHRDCRRELGLKARDQCLHVIHNLYCVHTWLAKDDQQNPPILVVPGQIPLIFNVIKDASELRKPDRRSVAVGYDQLLIISSVEKLTAGFNGRSSLWTPKRAGRKIYVSVGQRLLNLINANQPSRERLRVHLN